MGQAVLVAAVFCIFGFGFYVANKADQLLNLMQESMKDESEEKQHSPKMLFLDTRSDEELLRKVHECKKEYKEAEIIIIDGRFLDVKKIFDHNTVA